MRKLRVRWLLAVVGIALAVAGSEARAQNSRKSPIVEAVQKTRTSIVIIKAPRSSGRDATGTGVIVDERGYVVTNSHVVGAAKSVVVHMVDGKEVAGTVLFRDPSCDLAIVQLARGKKYPSLSLAVLDEPMVGETVIAVGHPFGYSFTVSTGIVSALNREITMPSGDVLTGLIQTDASINPGNSGGPLLNINGELIGINCALRDGAQGIAFAINATMVQRVVTRQMGSLHVGNAGVNNNTSGQIGISNSTTQVAIPTSTKQ